jgi:hypothetical protein
MAYLNHHGRVNDSEHAPKATLSINLLQGGFDFLQRRNVALHMQQVYTGGLHLFHQGLSTGARVVGAR